MIEDSQDPFLISYSAGFALFITLSILVSLAVLIVIYVNIREAESESVATFLGLIVVPFLGLIVALVWSAARFPYQQEFEEPPYLAIVGVFVSGFFLLISLYVILAICVEVCEDILGEAIPDKAFVASSMAFLASSVLLLLPGFVLLTMYCSLMRTTEQYDYYGPMYVINVSVSVISFQGLHRYYGYPIVAWGNEWGCPSNNVWCESKVDKFYRCEFCWPPGEGMGCMDGTEDDAWNCILGMYGLDDDPLDDEYDQHVSPNDSNYFYGDCDTCSASVIDYVDYAMNLKKVGSIMSITGAVLLGLAGCIAVLVWTAQNCHCRGTSSVQQDQQTNNEDPHEHATKEQSGASVGSV